MRTGAVANFVHSDPLSIFVLRDEWNDVKRHICRENLDLIAEELQRKFEPIDSLLSAYFDIATSSFINKAKYSVDLYQSMMHIDSLVNFVDDFIEWSINGIHVVEENLRNLGVRNWMMAGSRLSRSTK